MALSDLQTDRQRRALLAVLSFTAAVSIHSLLSSNPWEYDDNATINNNNNNYNDDESRRMLQVETTALPASLMSTEDVEQLQTEDMLNSMNMDEEDANILAIPNIEFFGDLSAYADEDTEMPSYWDEDHDWGDGGKEVSRNLQVTDESNLLQGHSSPYEELIDTDQPIPEFTLEDAFEPAKIFNHTYAVLVYDPVRNRFKGLFNKTMPYVRGRAKLMNAFRDLSWILRKEFNETFNGNATQEVVIPISSGDAPGVRIECLEHYRKEYNLTETPDWYNQFIANGESCNNFLAPILHFGSVFRNREIFPNMIGMPPPEIHHLPCFADWATEQDICWQLEPGETHKKPQGRNPEMANTRKQIWSEMHHQVVWRGVDFKFVPGAFPLLHQGDYEDRLKEWPFEQDRPDITNNVIGAGFTAPVAARRFQRLEDLQNPDHPDYNPNAHYVATTTAQQELFYKSAAVTAMKDIYPSLTPRWKAVLLTAEAEVNATELGEQPWADMKISAYAQGTELHWEKVQELKAAEEAAASTQEAARRLRFGQHASYQESKTSAVGSPVYSDWENLGIGPGQPMSLDDMANYRYHIDIGGAGGTDYAGFVQKMAMPGLLFHPMSPTKDYIHDYFEPWEHYVPIKMDLSDLKEKFDWAQENTALARNIATKGTNRLRYLTSVEGFPEMFENDMIKPLQAIIDAYKPVSETGNWNSYSQAVNQAYPDLHQVIECIGMPHFHDSRRHCTETPP